MANIHHVKKEVDESLQNVDVQCRQNGAFYVSFLSCFMSGLFPVYFRFSGRAYSRKCCQLCEIIALLGMATGNAPDKATLRANASKFVNG